MSSDARVVVINVEVGAGRFPGESESNAVASSVPAAEVGVVCSLVVVTLVVAMLVCQRHSQAMEQRSARCRDLSSCLPRRRRLDDESRWELRVCLDRQEISGKWTSPWPAAKYYNDCKKILEKDQTKEYELDDVPQNCWPTPSPGSEY